MSNGWKYTFQLSYYAIVSREDILCTKAPFQLLQLETCTKSEFFKTNFFLVCMYTMYITLKTHIHGVGILPPLSPAPDCCCSLRNSQPRRVTVHLHYVGNFEALLQRYVGKGLVAVLVLKEKKNKILPEYIVCIFYFITRFYFIQMMLAAGSWPTQMLSWPVTL